MILELSFAGGTRKQCFNNLKKNLDEIEKQIMEEGITGMWGIFGNKGHRYVVRNNSGNMIRKYRKKQRKEFLGK